VTLQLGADDGGLAAPVMFAAVAEIARAVQVPVTADLEGGYGLPAAELVRHLAATGAVGCNLEDSVGGRLVDADAHAGFLAAVRAAADSGGIDLVINARIDAHADGAGTQAQQLADCIRRARLYLSAGADCVYPLFLSGTDAVRAVTERVDGPVNILFRSGVASIDELAAAGVARISFGSALRRPGSSRLPEMLSAIRAGDDPFAASG